MALFDLSLRSKLSLWGALLIIVTAGALTASNLVFTRENIKKNMLVRSEILGRSLVKTLYSAISQGDVWRAYEIINFPMRAEARKPSFQLEDFVVLDSDNRVFISTATKHYPLLADLPTLGPAFSQLQQQLSGNSGLMVMVEADKILLGIPLVSEGVTLGTLVLVHPTDYFKSSFDRVLKRTAWTTLLVLLILLPLSWYWGRRMAAPLILLTRYMADLGKKLPAALPDQIYPHNDELGRLFQVYGQMQRELVEKEAIEHQMMKSERLASLGRLTASIAHEINNPLGGLLTALDTVKQHAAADPVLERVLPLLERGLNQIKDIVAALLIEARAKGRLLCGQDIDDVHTLLAQEARKYGVAWLWDNSVQGEVALPATLVRQVLINLVLNAMQAAGEGGHIEVRATLVENMLVLEVRNDGRSISQELMEHMFEPFTSDTDTGQGLGLWVTHQIVEQLRGQIRVLNEQGFTRFRVTLPMEDAT